jgi:hypothetical protein
MFLSQIQKIFPGFCRRYPVFRFISFRWFQAGFNQLALEALELPGSPPNIKKGLPSTSNMGLSIDFFFVPRNNFVRQQLKKPVTGRAIKKLLSGSYRLLFVIMKIIQHYGTAAQNECRAFYLIVATDCNFFSDNY